MKTSFRPGLEALEERCVPAVITVTKLSDGVGVPGMTLREAVEKANLTPASDKIVFKTGLKGIINLDLGEIEISTSMKIVGPGVNKLTISGQDASRIFSISDPDSVLNVTVSKLTLTRGNGAGALFSGVGGAIYSSENLALNKVTLSHNHATGIGGAIMSGPPASAPTLTLKQCRLFGNSSDSSGGAINASGTVVIRKSLLSANHADLAGGAILAAAGADVTIENSTVSYNSADQGGGIFDNESVIVVRNSTLAGNNAVTAGGLYVSVGDVQVINSTLSGNFAIAGPGGGIRLDSGGSLSVVNSTLSGNVATAGGGGIFALGGLELDIHNSTIAYNRSSQGGGIRLENMTANLESTIVAHNLAGSGPDLFSDAVPGDTFTITNCLIGNTAGADLNQPTANVLNVDPLLGPLQNNGGPTQTHALLPGSPALNAGSNSLNLAFDQRGPKFKRVKGGLTDIGAFER